MLISIAYSIGRRRRGVVALQLWWLSPQIPSRFKSGCDLSKTYRGVNPSGIIGRAANLSRAALAVARPESESTKRNLIFNRGWAATVASFSLLPSTAARISPARALSRICVEKKRDGGREKENSEISSHQLNHSLVSFVQGLTGNSGELKNPKCPHPHSPLHHATPSGLYILIQKGTM